MRRRVACKTCQRNSIETEITVELRGDGRGRFVRGRLRVAEDFHRVTTVRAEREFDHDHVHSRVLLAQRLELSRLHIRPAVVDHRRGAVTGRLCRVAAIVMPDLEISPFVAAARFEFERVIAEVTGERRIGSGDRGNALQKADVQRRARLPDQSLLDESGLVEHTAGSHVQQAADATVAAQRHMVVEADQFTHASSPGRDTRGACLRLPGAAPARVGRTVGRVQGGRAEDARGKTFVDEQFCRGHRRRPDHQQGRHAHDRQASPTGLMVPSALRESRPRAAAAQHARPQTIDPLPGVAELAWVTSLASLVVTATIAA